MTEPPESQTRSAFRRFVAQEVQPRAAAIDRDETFPEELIGKLAAAGYLAPWLPPEQGGLAMDWQSYGILAEEVGGACASTRSLLTVHGMATYALQRCGSKVLKDALLPRLGRGEIIGAFAVSEPEVGSDAAHPQTAAAATAEGYRLTGRKTWITFGERADVFLLLATGDKGPTAFLLDADTPGLTVAPIRGMLGTRGSMMAELTLDGCPVPAARRIGREGLGFTMVISTALDLGRYSVACGCVGTLRACLEASTAYTARRRQFGSEIREHQLVRRIVTDMLTSLRCAELLCRRAGALRDERSPAALAETMIAKYYASTAARRAADDAVQLQGALGCSRESDVERFYRDAKVMEIIEGSNQIQQIAIADFAYQKPDPVQG